MGLLDRFKESKAIRCIEAALRDPKGVPEAVPAARRLRDTGAERCVPVLCEAIAQGAAPLQIEAARTLGAVYRRHADKRVLECLNTTILHERQPSEVRQAAIESLVEILDVRHAGSLIEVLKSNRSPIPVRSAALRALKQLGYNESVERLVEACLFGKRLDPTGAIRKWATNELIAVDDHDKLAKIFEIAHGRRKLRYRAISPEAEGPAPLVLLMARVDPKGSMRYLNQMVDDANPAIRTAAADAIERIRGGGLDAGSTPTA